MLVVVLTLGLLVGLVLGLTGAGGGILAVPALIFGLGWSVQQATPVALIAVACSATVGAVEGFRRRLVRYRAAALMAIISLPFTTLGLHLAQLFSHAWLLRLFAGVMLIVAYRLHKTSSTSVVVESANMAFFKGRIDPETGRFDWSWPTALLLGSIGGLTGLMTGMLGVGGGFVIVPMLKRYTDMSMHGIVATSLLVIALVGAGGIIVACLHGAVIPVHLALPFILATAVGMLAGRQLVMHLSVQRVQKVFAILLAIIAFSLLAKSTIID